MVDEFAQFGGRAIGDSHEDEFAQFGGKAIAQTQTPSLADRFASSAFPAMRYGRDILAGIGSNLQGIWNLPSQLANMAEQNPLLTQLAVGLSGAPRSAEPIQQGLAALSGKLPQTNIDMGKAFGIENPTTGDIIAKAIGEYGPFVPSGLGAIGDVAKGIKAGSLTKALDIIRPQKYAENIMSNLGEGRTLSQNAQSIAEDIGKSFASAKNEANAIYKPIFDNYRGADIYKGIDSPENYSATIKKYGAYDKYLPELKDLHEDFINNPTLDNAHTLQSKLGYEIRDMEKSLSKGLLSNTDKAKLQIYSKARDALKNDVNSFFNTADNTGLMSKLFDYSTENFAKNVAPYLENPAISQMAQGAIKNPKQLMSLISKFLSSENAEKIASDIGGNFHNKLLYSELGKQPTSAKNLLDMSFNLDKKGLSPFVSDEFRRQMQALSDKIRNLKTAKWVGGVAGGLTAAHQIPIVKDIL